MSLVFFGSQWGTPGTNSSGDANLSQVTWSGTTCPDGTNSNNDGGACLGHL